jgi:hypothetical protein
MAAVIELLGSRHQYACQVCRPHHSVFEVPPSSYRPSSRSGRAAVQGRRFSLLTFIHLQKVPRRLALPRAAQGLGIGRGLRAASGWVLLVPTKLGYPAAILRSSVRSDPLSDFAHSRRGWHRRRSIACSKDKTLGVDEAARCTAGLACRPLCREDGQRRVEVDIREQNCCAGSSDIQPHTSGWPVAIAFRFAERSFAR